jgi:rubrerythrin
MKHLIKPMTKNQVDNLVDALVENLKYCDSNIEYPNIDEAQPDDGVIAEWFYPIYNGVNDFSELTAIHMYTSQETEFEEIGELMLGIGLTEMKHFAKIGEMIKRLGGKIDQRYNNSGVAIGKTPKEALETAYDSEIKTIKFYESLSKKINQVKTTKTTEIVLQLIAKLIADENVHKILLQNTLSKFSTEQE